MSDFSAKQRIVCLDEKKLGTFEQSASLKPPPSPAPPPIIL